MVKNVGESSLPLKINVKLHQFFADSLALIKLLYLNIEIFHFMSQQIWDGPFLPLNNRHILLRLILIQCQKWVVNSLFETANELKTSIDP